MIDPGEFARMSDAARRGEVEAVAEWAAAQIGLLDRRPGSAEAMEATHRLEEVAETAQVVAFARAGRDSEMRNFLRDMLMDADGAAPEEAARIRAKAERIATTVGDETGRQVPLEAPAWARPMAPGEVQSRLVVTNRVRKLLGRDSAAVTFEAGPEQLSMRGDLSQVRVERRRIARVVWLLGGGRRDLDRLVFKDAAGAPLNWWDLGGYPGAKVTGWLRGLGYDVEKVTGRAALEDECALGRRHRV